MILSLEASAEELTDLAKAHLPPNLAEALVSIEAGTGTFNVKLAGKIDAKLAVTVTEKG